MSNESHVPDVPLGKRLARFATLIGVVFAIMAAVIVTQKLSQDALALVIGLTCGVMAMVPTLALGVFIWRREHAQIHAERLQQNQQPSYQNPPVIVVTPQALPSQQGGNRYSNAGYGADQGWMPAHNQRKFTIVGQED
jgi:hypothetical protein